MNYDAVSLPFSVIFLSFWSQIGESQGIRGASARIGYEEIKVAFERQWALDFTPGREVWKALLDWEKYRNWKSRGTTP